MKQEWGRRPQHPLFKEYWDRHRRLLWWCARRCARKYGGSSEDYIGLLTLRFNHALYSYREERGPFTTYFCSRLMLDVLKLQLRYESDSWALAWAKHEDKDNEIEVLHATAMLQKNLFFKPEEDAHDQIQEILKCFWRVEDLWKFLCKGMDLRDAEILWWRYARDDTYEGIATRYGVTKQRVEQLLRRALDHVRKRVGDLDAWTKLFKVQNSELEDFNFPEPSLGREETP